MKKLKFLAVCALFTIFGMQKTDAQSDVYIFWDCKTLWESISIEVNGTDGAITLNPEVRKTAYGLNFYKKAARKVTFPEAGRYNFSVTVETGVAIYHAEIVLNLEDDETHYVLLNSKLGNIFYFAEMSEKKGKKFLEKARKDKNYSFNKDYTYVKN